MNDRSIILFGGKGGVGKTTCSAAAALHLADAGKKTIVITSDMTPSLSDIFQAAVGDRVTRIDDLLFAYEISQDAIVSRWKSRFSRDFAGILSQLIDLDALDAESRHHLLDYIGSAPSLREETMLDLIVDLVETGDYDRVVWDTAPAGETLNLLNMPAFIRRHLRAGAKVFEGLDRIGKQLTGRKSISETMDEWIQVSDRISRFVRERTAFVIVANPEALVVKHVERLIRALDGYAVTVLGMVINCVVSGEDPGLFPSIAAVQAAHTARLRELAGSLPVATLPLMTGDLSGLPALRRHGQLLCRQLGLE